MRLIEYVSNIEIPAVFARRIRATPTEVYDWSNGNRPVPPKRCVVIESATGRQVTRQELRPDDWHELWPELIRPQTRKRA